MVDRCSFGEMNVGFWYSVAPPREPLKMRTGMRTMRGPISTKLTSLLPRSDLSTIW